MTVAEFGWFVWVVLWGLATAGSLLYLLYRALVWAMREDPILAAFLLAFVSALMLLLAMPSDEPHTRHPYEY